MNAPAPRDLIEGPDAVNVLALAERCSEAVREVEGYLLRGDDRGATEYMEDFARQHGRKAHNAVMKILEEIYELPDWRTFS